MKPFFLDSQSGSLFALYWPPNNDKMISRAILHVPAFGEEMNKSRRMVALQASALAEKGYAVLVFDLFGTGDSAGDFGDATWAVWLANVSDAVNWLRKQGAQNISLWSLRLGALLAIDYISRASAEISKLIAWQPVLNSETFVTQFLRLRVAATMMNSATPQEKTSDLKKRLQQGMELEVAGYQLNPELINPLMQTKVNSDSLKTLSSIKIFEIVPEAATQPSFVNQQFVDGLSAVGVEASLVGVVGENFWGHQEIVTVSALLEATENEVIKWL